MNRSKSITTSQIVVLTAVIVAIGFALFGPYNWINHFLEKSTSFVINDYTYTNVQIEGQK